MEVEIEVEDVPTFFLLVTSYFSLSFDFSPLSFLLLLLFIYFFILTYLRKLE